MLAYEGTAMISGLGTSPIHFPGFEKTQRFHLRDALLRDARPPQLQWTVLILRMELLFVADTTRILVVAPPCLNKQLAASSIRGQI